MANNLETEKKVLAVSMLAEGSSIRSIERVTGVHRVAFDETPCKELRHSMIRHMPITGEMNAEYLFKR